jgi:hypothetical protein
VGDQAAEQVSGSAMYLTMRVKVWGAFLGGVRAQRAPRPHRQEFRIASSLVASDRLQVHLAC